MNPLELIHEIKSALAAHIAGADYWKTADRLAAMTSFDEKCRTMSPFACKALLAAVEELEWQASDNRIGDTGRIRAHHALETICREWQQVKA